MDTCDLIGLRHEVLDDEEDDDRQHHRLHELEQTSTPAQAHPDSTPQQGADRLRV